MSTELPEDCPVPSADAENRLLDDSGEIVLAAKFEAVNPQTMSSNHNNEVQMGEQVLGYLEVQPSDLGVDQENATIFLQPQEIEIDGQHVILTQEGEGGNEIIVVVTNPDSPLWDAEQDNPNQSKGTAASLTQSTVINSSATTADHSDRTRTLIVGGAHVGQHIELISSNLVESADSVESVSVCPESERQHRSSALKTESSEISSSSWNIPTSKLPENEDSTEMLFIPTPSVLSSSGGLTTSLVLSTSEVETKHRSLMQLACIAQKLQSSSDKTDNKSEPHSSENCHDSAVRDSPNSSNLHELIKPQDQNISSSSYVLAEVSESLLGNQKTSILTSLHADTTVTSSSNKACFSSSAIMSELISDHPLPTLSSRLPDTCSATADQTSSNLEVSSSSSCMSEHETSLDLLKTVSEHPFNSKHLASSDDENCFVKENEQLDLAKEPSSVDDTSNLGTGVFLETEEIISFQTDTRSGRTLSSSDVDSLVVQTENSAFPVQENADPSCENNIHSKDVIFHSQVESISSNDLSPEEAIEIPVNIDVNQPHESEEAAFSHGSTLLNSGSSESIVDDAEIVTSPADVTEISANPAVADSDTSLSPVDTVEEPAISGIEVCNESSRFSDADMQESSVCLEKTLNPVASVSESSFSVAEETEEIQCESFDGPATPKAAEASIDFEKEAVESITECDNMMEEDSKIEQELLVDSGTTGSSVAAASTFGIALSKEKLVETDPRHSVEKQDRLVQQAEVCLKASLSSTMDKEVLKRKLNEYDFEDDGATSEIKTFEDERISKKPRLTSRLEESDMKMMEASSSEKAIEKGFLVKAKSNSVTETGKNASPTIIRISVGSPEEMTEKINPEVLDVTVTVPESEKTECTTSAVLEVYNDNEGIGEEEIPVNQTAFIANPLNEECSGVDEHLPNVSKKDEDTLANVVSNSDIDIIESQIERPKKTYTRQSKPKTNSSNGALVNESDCKENIEIELFSCDELGEPSSQRDMDQLSPFQDRGSTSDAVQPNGVENEEALSSGIEKPVSTTYKGVKGLVEKKKSWSLRARTSPKGVPGEVVSVKQKKRASESSPLKSAKKARQEDKDNVGTEGGTADVEAATSVENRPMKIQSESAGTSSGDDVKNTDNSVAPNKRSKAKSLKSKPASVILWEKLVKSPPGKVKTSKFFSGIRRKQVKHSVLKMKAVPSHSFCLSPRSSSLKHKRTFSEPPVPTALEDRIIVPITPLKPLDVRIRCQPSPKFSEETYLYHCGNCKFRCNRLENLIQHYKARCLREGSYMFEVGINDMDRRQRIRGEDTSDTSDSKAYHSVFGLSRSSYSEENGLLKQCDFSDGESEDEMSPNSDKSKNTFGFKEGDIVWAEWKNVFWPSLVRHVYPKEKKVFVFLVGTPVEKKSMKISVGKIQPFDNAELNKKLLGKGGGFPNKEVFVKAVQKAEDFVRKKLLGMSVNPSQFFENLDDSIADTSDVESCVSSHSEKQSEKPIVSGVDDESPVQISASSSCMVIDVENDGDAAEECSTTANEKSEIQIEKSKQLVSCIKDGNVDDHLLGILNCSIQSKRHSKFHSTDKSETDVLKNETWFGPIYNEKEQLDISDYCMHLLKSKSADKGTFDRISYIFEVWVPEHEYTHWYIYYLHAIEAQQSVLRIFPISNCPILVQHVMTMDLFYQSHIKRLHAIIKAVSFVEKVPLPEAEEIFIKHSLEKAGLCLDTSSASEESHKEKLLLRMRDAFVSEEIAQALSE